MRGRAILAVALLAMGAPRRAWAHGEKPHLTAGAVWDMVTVAGLLVAAVVYVSAWRRVSRDSSPALGLRAAAPFFAGLVVVSVALFSPLDAASDVRFSAHMGQHELLVLFAAPLFVAGRADAVVVRALPARARAALARALRSPGLRNPARHMSSPWFALVVHGLVTWVWHLPTLFEAALRDETVHAAQHLSFFATAALFWWTLVRGRGGRLGYGLAVLFVFSTALHKGLLGALFTFATHTIYPTHAERTRAAGADPLRDQELAGLLMWVPAGAVMASLALGLFVVWLGALERRDASRLRRAAANAPRCSPSR